MFHTVLRLSSMVFLSLLLTHTLYGETVSKHPTTEVLTSNTLLNTDKEQNDMRLIDEMIRKKQALLKKNRKIRYSTICITL